jgi:hypothetical protein
VALIIDAVAALVFLGMALRLRNASLLAAGVVFGVAFASLAGGTHWHAPGWIAFGYATGLVASIVGLLALTASSPWRLRR